MNFNLDLKVDKVMKVCIEKHGLWQTIIAFIALLSAPIIFWKLDTILLAIANLIEVLK